MRISFSKTIENIPFIFINILFLAYAIIYPIYAVLSDIHVILGNNISSAINDTLFIYALSYLAISLSYFYPMKKPISNSTFFRVKPSDKKLFILIIWVFTCLVSLNFINGGLNFNILLGGGK